MSTDEATTTGIDIAVAADVRDNQVRARAAALADELRLPLVVPEESTGRARPLLLIFSKGGLGLCETRRGAAGPVYVDFVYGPAGFRRRSSLSRRQPIALAVGLRRGPVTVVDATAGLARDSFLLACLGCNVTAIERSAVLGALIRDGLRRAALEELPALAAVLKRITLVVDDARAVLAQMDRANVPDVVYLDPMYPPKGKTALPGKEMRICRRLVGDDRDAGELLAIALRVAGRRVVVKRPRHAPPLAPNPVTQFKGKQVRYDVYLPLA